jgi:hypothetical protein
MTSPRFTVLIPVLPTTVELNRLSNLLEGLCYYESNITNIILINDSLNVLDLTTYISRSIHPKVVNNPRRDRGNGWAGGLCCGIRAGLRSAKTNCDSDFVIKLDTDSLVIAPFSEKINNLFVTTPHVGLIGTYKSYPDHRPRDLSPWSQSLKTYLKPIALRGKHLQVTLWGSSHRIRQALERALASGYRFAEHCQGGAYAISAQAIQRMDALGYLEYPLDWLNSGITEDVMMGVLVRACGLESADFNRDQQPFGVQFTGLAYSPEEFVNKGYSIIHSIKNDPKHSEEYIVDFFKKRIATNAACERS